MRRLPAVVVLVVLAAAGFAAAEEREEASESESPRAAHLAVGGELMDLKSDFGVGLNMTSPYFIGGAAAIRAHGGISWFNGVREGEAEYEWVGYVPLRLGFVMTVGTIGPARFFSEAGVLLVPPNDNLSGDLTLGGYGHFGFESFTMEGSPVAYYLQAGAVGSNGEADELFGRPTFANGFLLEVGVRWYPY